MPRVNYADYFSECAGMPNKPLLGTACRRPRRATFDAEGVKMKKTEPPAPGPSRRRAVKSNFLSVIVVEVDALVTHMAEHAGDLHRSCHGGNVIGVVRPFMRRDSQSYLTAHGSEVEETPHPLRHPPSRPPGSFFLSVSVSVNPPPPPPPPVPPPRIIFPISEHRPILRSSHALDVKGLVGWKDIV